jgi:tetratricopeptide (TPR) repeat protein
VARGRIAFEQQQGQRVEELLQRALPLLREAGDAEGLTEALALQVKLLVGQGRSPQALPPLREAIALYAARGDRRLECLARMWLVMVGRHLAPIEQHLQEAQAAHALAERTADLGLQQTCATVLSGLHRARAEPAPALRYALEALEHSRRMGAPARVQTALIYLGCLSTELFGSAVALGWLEQAHALGAEEDPMASGWRGVAELAEDRAEQAVSTLSAAIEGFEASRGEEFVGIFLAHRAQARLLQGQPELALADLDRAVQIGQRLGLPHVEASARAWRAVARARRGQPGASDDLQAAAPGIGSVRSGLGHVQLALCRAEVAWLAQDEDEARSLLGQARQELHSREVGPTTQCGAQLRRLEERLVAQRHTT